MSITVPHVSLLVDAWVRLEGVLVEQDSGVPVASVRNELVSGVRYVVTGFLQDDCVESSASGGNDLWESCALGLDSIAKWRGDIDNA